MLLPDERWRVWPPGTSLLTFLTGPVRSFFLAQSIVEEGEPWPFGQWAHGAKGVLQYYRELIKTLTYLRCDLRASWATGRQEGEGPLAVPVPETASYCVTAISTRSEDQGEDFPERRTTTRFTRSRRQADRPWNDGTSGRSLNR